MRITATVSDLAASVAAVSQACASNSTIPALQNLKAVASDGVLTLTAHDPSFGVCVRHRCPCDTHEPGTAILARAEFAAILKESTEPLTVATAADGVHVTCNGATYVLQSFPADEFPDVPDAPDVLPYVLPASALRVLIARTVFAADKKDTTAKFALQSVRFEFATTVLRLLATDTKRLASCSAPLTSPGADDAPSVLAPLRAITLLDRNLSDDDSPVSIRASLTGLSFASEAFTLHTALMQGKFPPAEQILAKSRRAPVLIPLPVASFHQKVRQAAICTDDESQRIDLTFGPGIVTLTARGAKTGSSNVTMPLADYDGPELALAFDPDYLCDYLKALAGEPTVTLRVQDGKSAALLECGASCCLIMPLTG